MATVRDLIADALKELGAIAIGETPTDAEAQDALGVLNNMIGSWRLESLMVSGMEQNVYIIPSNQPSYTIGIGGDINTTRPNAIESAYVRDTNNNDYELYVTTNYQDYSDIVTKTVTSTIPVILYYNVAEPLGTIYLWPEPSDSSYRLVLWTWTIIDSYASYNDTLSLLPGWQRALTSNLAIDLAPRYGCEIAPSLAVQAAGSKAQIKKYNLTVKTMNFDGALSGGSYRFNYLTGQPH